jgi:hypothetical protein
LSFIALFLALSAIYPHRLAALGTPLPHCRGAATEPASSVGEG